MVLQEHHALVSAGHVVETFGRSSDEIQDLSFSQKALIPFRLVRSRASAEALRTALRRFRPDVVHVHNLFPLLSPSVLAACRDEGIPCVATFHNYLQVCGGCTLFRTGNECRACVDKRLPVAAVLHGCYRGSSIKTLPMAVSTVANRSLWQTVPAGYIFISQAQLRELRHLGFPPDRCFVKHNFSPEPARRGRPDGTISYLGRLTESKGLEVLIRAWERHVASGPTTLRLVIAGSGPLEQRVRNWAAGVPSVQVAGHLSRDDSSGLIARSSAVVVPSEWPEPFGLVVIEAMAAGVAPIATARGAFPELINDGVNGRLYPAGDDAALAGLLRSVESTPARQASLGTAARTSYERRFTPEVSVARLEEIYRYAVEHPRTTRPSTSRTVVRTA